MRDRAEASAPAILALAMVLATAALLYWGRGQVMVGDDLFYAQRLAESSLGHAILHSNLYLIALPMVLYKAMFELFGIGSYLPYRLVAIALGLLCVALFYAIARRRIGGLFALFPTVLLLFYGSGGEELLTGTRIPSLFAIASGLGAILALEREDRRGDAIATVLLCVSATSHPTGLGFLAASAILIAFRPSPRRWTTAWVVAVPAALVAAFLLFYQRTADTPHQGIVDVLSFERASWTMLTAAVSGLSGVLSEPVFNRPLADVASALLLVVICVGAALRWRRLRPTFWAAAGGLIVLLAATRLSPGGFIRVMPPGPAGAERLTVKVKLVVPALPSLSETSLIVRLIGGTALGVSEKSSTARPSSAPVASVSVQRIQNVAPLAMLSAGIVEESAVRSAAALPFLAPVVDRVRGDEVEGGDVRPGAGHQVRGVEAVLEVHLVGPPRRPQAPLLAGVGDRQAGDRRAGVVGEAGAEEGDQRAAAQLAQGPLRAGGRAVAVHVARRAAAGVDGVLLVVPRAAPRLGQEPPGDRQVVGRAPGRVGERVEVLRGSRPEGRQADALGGGGTGRRQAGRARPGRRARGARVRRMT